MDRIPVPEDQMVPIENVAAGVCGLRIAFVNVFAVTHPDGSRTLIDAALPFTAALIRRWAPSSLGQRRTPLFSHTATSITRVRRLICRTSGVSRFTRMLLKLHT
jgi:hypothetical protein